MMTSGSSRRGAAPGLGMRMKIGSAIAVLSAMGLCGCAPPAGVVKTGGGSKPYSEAKSECRRELSKYDSGIKGLAGGTITLGVEGLYDLLFMDLLDSGAYRSCMLRKGWTIEHSDDLIVRGVEKYKAGNYAGAIVDYSRAIELNPKDADAFNLRGNARLSKGDVDGAIADYSQAITLNPKAAASYRRRGIARASNMDHDGAIADLNKAIALDPKDAVAFNFRGNVKVAKGDFDGGGRRLRSGN